ncbi:unnamed protein product [Lota lota]
MKPMASKYHSNQKWNITRLTFEPYCRERDAAILKMAHEHGAETCVRNSQHALHAIQARKNGTPPFSLYSQLMWREFFYTVGTDNPSFDRMEGNPICVQIPWDHNTEALAKWAQGQTGFPWIDAVMT